MQARCGGLWRGVVGLWFGRLLRRNEDGHVRRVDACELLLWRLGLCLWCAA